MKITIISLDQWGFDKHIVDYLDQMNDVEVHHIDFSKFTYVYPSIFHKITNFFAKNLFNYNIKKAHLNKEIINQLKKLPKQDKILMIKADHLLPQKIEEIKNYTHEFIAYFSDSTNKCPKIKKIHHLFDSVYSFEKDDVSLYGFNFITNYIYNEQNDNSTKKEFSVFNISAFDKRIKTLEKIAVKLDTFALNYKIISVGNNTYNSSSSIIFTKDRMKLNTVETYINKSIALLDINREGQYGLTFRVFESLGNKKKLITTNNDIVNYDFYNKNNILVVNKDDIKIPLDFFKTPYQEIPTETYNKSGLSHCVKTVFDI
ncbi:MAG TPA: hypothetical protein DEO36_05725 [Flavobacteriaceae bacterium]|nr:hypothetical protein [Flavobacteriaceae bacterium]